MKTFVGIVFVEDGHSRFHLDVLDRLNTDGSFLVEKLAAGCTLTVHPLKREEDFQAFLKRVLENRNIGREVVIG